MPSSDEHSEEEGLMENRKLGKMGGATNLVKVFAVSSLKRYLIHVFKFLIE